VNKALLLLTTAMLLASSALNGPAVARDRADRPELAPNQIAAQVDAHTARIKADLRLTAEQEKNWAGFETAMRDIGKKQTDREIARRTGRGTQRDPIKEPVDAIAQMRAEAEVLSARAADQRALADAAQPLYASLDDQQKRRLAVELTHRSRDQDIQ
jgi:LTXXQ motif family protein